MTERELMDCEGIKRTLKRISHEILERNTDPEKIVLVGIHTRGVYLARRIQENILEIEGSQVAVETLDITFYRDDLSKNSDAPQVSDVNFKQDLNNQHVIIVDDVLYTGRTVRAAMDAILDYARPSFIQLAVLIDRGHRELPIRPDFIGKNIPTAKTEQVKVELKEVDSEDQVTLINHN